MFTIDLPDESPEEPENVVVRLPAKHKHLFFSRYSLNKIVKRVTFYNGGCIQSVMQLILMRNKYDRPDGGNSLFVQLFYLEELNVQ